MFGRVGVAHSCPRWMVRPMGAPITVEELLRLIRKSGIVEETRVNQFLIGKAIDPTADARPLTEEMVSAGLLTHFQAEQLLQGKWRGFTIGQYRYLERIGVGGMGQVFLCEHTQTKERVAIKVLPPSKAEQPAALGRFYREARAAAALHHPNLVRTHEIDQDGEYHFIVMDYVAGTNLLELIKRFGPMDIARATSYVHQVAQALDFAFRNKIIHRDVKPGNILIDEQGVARLLDLGLARFINDHGDPLTLKYDDKIVLGTADYVAPEQIENSHAVDTRADLYALGSTFYFLLAGHPPFPTGTVSQKLLWHRTREPAPLREVRPEVPERLAAILEKMMRKDPAERYQTPAQLLSDLEALLPASVPLPGQEEMPKLSPAAAAPPNCDPRPAKESSGHEGPGPDTLHAASSTTPATLLARPQGLPAHESDSWGLHEPCAPATASTRALSSETDRIPTRERMPPRRARHTHPTGGSKSAPPPARSVPWGLIGAIVVIVLIGIVLLVG